MTNYMRRCTSTYRMIKEFTYIGKTFFFPSTKSLFLVAVNNVVLHAGFHVIDRWLKSAGVEDVLYYGS